MIKLFTDRAGKFALTLSTTLKAVAHATRAPPLFSGCIFNEGLGVRALQTST
jgi:hypothetical protein